MHTGLALLDRRLSPLRSAKADWPHALRVAAGLILPGLTLVVAGHPEFIIYAAFGSFVGMYGRTEAHRVRLRHQLQAGAVLVAGVGGGVAMAEARVGPVVLVGVVAVFAFGATLLTHRWGLTPQGPFFGIFALGAVATLPAGQGGWPAGVLIAASTALLSVGIGFAGRQVRPADSADAGDSGNAEGAADGSGAGPILCSHERWATCLTLHATRYAAAVAAAGVAGTLLGVDHANWAMAAAAVPLAAAHRSTSLHPTPRRVLDRSLHRIVGTLAGLVVTALLLAAHPSPAWLALVAVAFLFPTELFMSHHYGVALGFFTPLIMAMTVLAAPAAPLTLVTGRVVDTVLGVAVGAAVAVVVRGRERRRVPTRRRPLCGDRSLSR